MADINERALSQLAKWAAHNERVHAADEEAERALSVANEKVDTLHNLLDKVPVEVEGEKPIDAERRAKKVAKIDEALDKVIEQVEALVAV